MVIREAKRRRKTTEMVLAERVESALPRQTQGSLGRVRRLLPWLWMFWPSRFERVMAIEFPAANFADIAVSLDKKCQRTSAVGCRQHDLARKAKRVARRAKRGATIQVQLFT